MMTTSPQQILALLAADQQEIARRFGVKRLSLFGSAARGDLRDESDVDILVEFAGPATYDGYFGLKDHLESLLGRTVDLVTERGLKPRARRQVEKDLILVV
jgi:predicted nucleotidyltransferase